MQILIPQTAPHSSAIIQGWCNGPVSGQRTNAGAVISTSRRAIAQMVSRLSLIPLQETKGKDYINFSNYLSSSEMKWSEVLTAVTENSIIRK
jgi:hypothetical protein